MAARRRSARDHFRRPTWIVLSGLGEEDRAWVCAEWVREWSGFVGFDGAAFVGEIFCEWVVGKGAQAGDDTFGVEDGSCHGGVGVGIAEEGIDCGLAKGVVAAGEDLVEVDEAYVLDRKRTRLKSRPLGISYA